MDPRGARVQPSKCAKGNQGGNDRSYTGYVFPLSADPNLSAKDLA